MQFPHESWMVWTYEELAAFEISDSFQGGGGLDEMCLIIVSNYSLL